MEGRPWCFDNTLLFLDEILGDEQPSKVTLIFSPFWVRIDDLPLTAVQMRISK